MKFDVLNLIDGGAMEDGAWIQLTSPLDGEPLYRDPDERTVPCRVKVRSADCQRMTDYVQKHQAATGARLQRMRAKQRDDFARTAVTDRIRGMFAIQLVALDNCSSEKAGIVEVSEEDALAIYDDPAMRWLVEQVIAFSNDPSNFGRPTSAGEEPAASKAKTTRRT